MIDSNETRYIFEHLSDEQSRDIFSFRLMAFLTNERYIGEIVKRYDPELYETSKDLFYFFWNSMPQNNSFILYGAGATLSKYLWFIKECAIPIESISAICDRDEKKWGKSTKGIQITSPDILNQDDRSNIVVCSDKYGKEIYDDLHTKYGERVHYLSADSFIKYSDEQYFDPDIITFSENEVFVDTGACGLEISIELMKRRNAVKKVYAFEPDPTNIMRCEKIKDEKNLTPIEIVPYGAYSRRAELPLFILKLVPEYRLYLRHSTNDSNETVLYAVV